MIKRTEKVNRIFDKARVEKERIDNNKLNQMLVYWVDHKAGNIMAESIEGHEITSDIMDIGALTSTPEVVHETEAKKEDREHKTFFWLCVCIFVALVVAFAESYK